MEMRNITGYGPLSSVINNNTLYVKEKVLTREEAEEKYVQKGGDVELTGDGSALTELNADNISSGTLNVARGGTGTDTHTASKLLVGAGTDAISSPSDLHWDAVDNRLGINTDSPSEALDVAGNANVSGNLIADGINAGTLTGDGSAISDLNADNFTSGTVTVGRGGTGTDTHEAGRILVGNGTDAILSPADLHWDVENSRLGVNTDTPTETLEVGGNVVINGSLTKESGTFNIAHPLLEKKDTHRLVHSFIEGPSADLIYSGTVVLGDGGEAKVNIDQVSNMTAGTFEALTINRRRITTNESGFTNVRSALVGAELTIVAEDSSSRDEVTWMVVAERNDAAIKASSITDAEGRLIVEPEIIA